MSSDVHPISQIHAAGAPEFVTMDAQKLLDMAKAHFEVSTGRTMSPSQVEMYLLETIAYMLSVHAAEEQLGFENCFVAYARSEWLDLYGVDRSTPRLLAVPATTILRYATASAAASRIRIPAGSRVSDAAGQVQFLTLADASIEVGQSSVDVKAEATAPGIFANGFPVGELSQIVDVVPGLASVINLSETGGGAETEDDARYRVRLALAFERIGNGLSRERYVSDVLGWNARCIHVAVARPQPGYVNIYPLMDTGAPNAEEIASLQALFDGSNTHQGDFISVIAPQSEDFDFELALTLTDAAQAAPAEAAVQAVVDRWAQRMGGYIAPSELTSAAKAVEGVLEADIPDLNFAAVALNKWRRCTDITVTTVVV